MSAISAVYPRNPKELWKASADAGSLQPAAAGQMGGRAPDGENLPPTPRDDYPEEMRGLPFFACAAPWAPPLSAKMFQPGPGSRTPAQCCLSFAANSEPNPDSPAGEKPLLWLEFDLLRSLPPRGQAQFREKTRIPSVSCPLRGEPRSGCPLSETRRSSLLSRTALGNP